MKTPVWIKFFLLFVGYSVYFFPVALGQQTKGYLNGKTFNISVIEKFADGRVSEWEEILRFENNKVHSGFAASIRFGPSDYDEFVDSSGVVYFTSESPMSLDAIGKWYGFDSDVVPEDHLLKWRGSLSEKALNGYVQKYESGVLVREYWFHADLESTQLREFDQLDSAGLKHGWWTTYLDENLVEIENENADTVYYWYAYYNHGYNVSRRGPFGSKKQTCTVPPNLQPDSTGYILLNGEFKSLDKNGNAQYVINAVDGYLTMYQTYYTSGALRYYFDYTKLYNDRLHTAFFAEYKKSGDLKYSGYFRKTSLKNGRAVWLIFIE